MDEGFFDTLLLVAGLALILLTFMRFSRRRPRGKPAEGQRMAAIGMVIWLGLLALSLYLIFG
jgi:uncharacterized membrane protein SirB2